MLTAKCYVIWKHSGVIYMHKFMWEPNSGPIRSSVIMVYKQVHYTNCNNWRYVIPSAANYQSKSKHHSSTTGNKMFTNTNVFYLFLTRVETLDVILNDIICSTTVTQNHWNPAKLGRKHASALWWHHWVICRHYDDKFRFRTLRVKHVLLVYR